MGSCLSRPEDKPHLNGASMQHASFNGIGPVLPSNTNMCPSPPPAQFVANNGGVIISPDGSFDLSNHQSIQLPLEIIGNIFSFVDDYETIKNLESIGKTSAALAKENCCSRVTQVSLHIYSDEPCPSQWTPVNARLITRSTNNGLFSECKQTFNYSIGTAADSEKPVKAFSYVMSGARSIKELRIESHRWSDSQRYLSALEPRISLRHLRMECFGSFRSYMVVLEAIRKFPGLRNLALVGPFLYDTFKFSPRKFLTEKAPLEYLEIRNSRQGLTIDWTTSILTLHNPLKVLSDIESCSSDDQRKMVFGFENIEFNSFPKLYSPLIGGMMVIQMFSKLRKVNVIIKTQEVFNRFNRSDSVDTLFTNDQYSSPFNVMGNQDSLMDPYLKSLLEEFLYVNHTGSSLRSLALTVEYRGSISLKSLVESAYEYENCYPDVDRFRHLQETDLDSKTALVPPINVESFLAGEPIENFWVGKKGNAEISISLCFKKK